MLKMYLRAIVDTQEGVNLIRKPDMKRTTVYKVHIKMHIKGIDFNIYANKQSALRRAFAWKKGNEIQNTCVMQFLL